VIFLSGGHHGTENGHPEYENTEERLHPEEPAIEDISQRNLNDCKYEHGSKRSYQSTIFKPMETMKQPLKHFTLH
jgi:hypothetical protein